MITAIDPALRTAAAWALLHSLWQFSLIAAVVAITHAFFRRSARLRYILAFTGLLLMPVLLTATTISLLPSAPLVAPQQPSPPAPTTIGINPTPSDPINVTSAAPSVPTAPASWQSTIDAHATLILTGYLAGAALCLLRLSLGSTYLVRLRRGASLTEPALQAAANRLSATLCIARPVHLLQSPHIDSPSVLGIWRPLILIPTSALTRISIPELETLLAHELAHIRRHDHLANLLQSLLEAALFYHPALWWLSARIRQEREHCCDDIAIALTGNRAAYAHALASMESLRALPASLALSARTGRLLPRIQRILNTRITPPRPSLATRALLLTLTTLSLLLAATALYTGCATATPPSNAAAASPPTTAPFSAEDRDQWYIKGFQQKLDFSANALPLETALDNLQKMLTIPGGHLGIDPDWPHIEAAGIPRNTPVTVDLHDTPAVDIVKAIIRAAAGDTLAYDPVHSVVSTPAAIKSRQFDRIAVYDVRDILQVNKILQAGAAQSTTQPSPIDRLIQSITTTVDPASWSPPHSIRTLNGQLIVYQTDLNQAAVYAYIQQLRNAAAVQIRIDTHMFLADESLHALILKNYAHLARPAPAVGAVLPARPAVSTVLSPAAAASFDAALRASHDTITLADRSDTYFNWQNGLFAITHQRNIIDRCDPPTIPTGKPLLHVATLTFGTTLQVQPVILSSSPNILLHVDATFRQLRGLDTLASPEPQFYIVQVPRITEAALSNVVAVSPTHTLLLGGIPVAPDTGEYKDDAQVHFTTPHYLYLTLTPTPITEHEIELPIGPAKNP